VKKLRQIPHHSATTALDPGLTLAGITTLVPAATVASSQLHLNPVDRE
jgi:hypothetical protein